MQQIGKGRRYEIRQVIPHVIDGVARPQITVLHSTDTPEEANELADTLRKGIDESRTHFDHLSRDILGCVAIDVFDAGPAPRI